MVMMCDGLFEIYDLRVLNADLRLPNYEFSAQTPFYLSLRARRSLAGEESTTLKQRGRSMLCCHGFFVAPLLRMTKTHVFYCHPDPAVLAKGITS